MERMKIDKNRYMWFSTSEDYILSLMHFRNWISSIWWVLIILSGPERDKATLKCVISKQTDDSELHLAIPTWNQRLRCLRRRTSSEGRGVSR